MFVIINLELPSNFLQNIAPSSSRNDVVQAEEHHDQANEDLMEEDDGTNQMIQYFLLSRMRMGTVMVFMMNLY